MNVHQSYFAITSLLFQKQRLKRRKHHLLSQNWANPMAARDWGARWWFLQFTSFFHQISSSDQFFKFFGLFSDVCIRCCVSILSSLLTKKLLRNLSEPHFLVSAPCVTEPDGIVGGISISTIHDQFSNQCSRGCCCWCTDCQGWNIKLYTILLFISGLTKYRPSSISIPFTNTSVSIQEELARKKYLSI